MQTFLSGSLSSSKGKAIFAFHLTCDSMLSADTPATIAPALRNLACAAANATPSRVQPEVLSRG